MTARALLIVHGIGEQRKGETTEKLVCGLTAAFGDRLEVRRREDGHAVGVRAVGVDVHFHEVYWADLLSREANRGALSWSTLTTLAWQPLVCRRAGLLPAAEYPRALVGAWFALLLPASLLSYPLTQGARFFAQIFDPDRKARIEARARGLRWWQRGQVLADAAAHEDTLVEEVLEGVVADVPAYMSSAARGEGVAFEVLARFHEAMRAARRHQTDEVHVLAHSLGTVVAYHALTGMAQPPGDPPHAPRRLYTIGSPLEKIRFFWPWTLRRAAPSVHPDFRWTNFYHRMDSVSGRLRRFAAWAPLENLRLRGGGGLLRSHVVYEKSPEFLGALTEELFGERRVPPLTAAARLKDRAITAGENLIAPAAIAASLVLGVSLLTIVLLAGPYLLSLPLRWLGMDVWGARVSSALSIMLIGGMAIVLVMELRRCYRSACEAVALAARRAAAAAEPSATDG